MIKKMITLLGVGAATLLSSVVIMGLVMFVANIVGAHYIQAIGYSRGLAPLGVIMGIILFNRFFTLRG